MLVEVRETLILIVCQDKFESKKTWVHFTFMFSNQNLFFKAPACFSNIDAPSCNFSAKGLYIVHNYSPFLFSFQINIHWIQQSTQLLKSKSLVRHSYRLDTPTRSVFDLFPAPFLHFLSLSPLPIV